MEKTLVWRAYNGYEEATIGNWSIDGVRFCLSYNPTCYRRGQWRLLVEICGGVNHELWGCFDQQDQPMRYYHNCDCAKKEAQSLADVLVFDHMKCVKGV